VDLGPLIAISIALGALAWLAFLWSVRSGQYDDPEGPKYRMLDDDDEIPAPRGEPPPRPARRQDGRRPEPVDERPVPPPGERPAPVDGQPEAPPGERPAALPDEGPVAPPGERPAATADGRPATPPAWPPGRPPREGPSRG
jgi:cbb3-type cytochrome oxidase maturation protein